jgi:hypothetical protein
MRNWLPAVLVSLLATGLLPAAAEGRKIEVRFVAQVAPEGLGEIVMATDELRSDPFALPLNFLSERQPAPGRAFRLELRDRPTVLAKIAFPEIGSDFIVLLVPGVEGGFEPVVIPSGDSSFRPGDYYVHNVSARTVAGMVGTTKFVIRPRQGQVVRPRGAREGRFYDVSLGVRDGETARVISTSRWPLGKRMRTYVFFFESPKRKDIDFRAVDEFVPQTKKGKPSAP